MVAATEGAGVLTAVADGTAEDTAEATGDTELAAEDTAEATGDTELAAEDTALPAACATRTGAEGVP